MTVKLVKTGGNDWSDGDILFAADQNDTFNVTISSQNASVEDTAEYSVNAGGGAAGGTYADLGYSKTFTPTNVLNMILGLKVTWDTKGGVETSNSLYYRVKMVNDTTNQVAYFTINEADLYSGTGDTRLYLTSRQNTSYATQTETAYPINTTEVGSSSNTGELSIKTLRAAINGETYTFTIEASEFVNGVGSRTAYVTNITLEIIWKILGVSEVTGWA